MNFFICTHCGKEYYNEEPIMLSYNASSREYMVFDITIICKKCNKELEKYKEGLK